MWVFIVAMRCGSTEPPLCPDLGEGECAHRSDCVAVYHHGACEECPAIFGGCVELGGPDPECTGVQDWTCGEPAPDCGSPAGCTPAADDPCLAIEDANECNETNGCEATTLDCDLSTSCTIFECRPTNAKVDCEEISSPSVCRGRSDCVVRVSCRPEIADPCLEFCRAPCQEEADCESYEGCIDDTNLGQAACEITESSCRESTACNLP